MNKLQRLAAIAGRGENQTGYTCTDTIGFITPTELLITGSPFTAHLRFTLQEPPEEVGLSATGVTDDDELKNAGYGTRAWRLTPEHIKQLQENDSKKYRLPSEREPEINLSLPPGIYVLNVDVTWKDKGSVTYGFLVQVNKVSPTEKAAGFEVQLAVFSIAVVLFLRRKVL